MEATRHDPCNALVVLLRLRVVKVVLLVRCTGIEPSCADIYKQCSTPGYSFTQHRWVSLGSLTTKGKFLSIPLGSLRQFQR